MTPLWDDALDAPIGSDGSPALVGHIVTRKQAERWQAAGYDIAEAVDRYRDLLGRWEGARTEEAADTIVDEFYAAEAEQLRSVGIDETDPDFHRILSAAKFHEWA